MKTVQFIAPTKRKPMTKARRTRIFLSRNGICCICTTQIRDGEWIIEHPDAVNLGGSDDDADLWPAHEKCRRLKDKQDAKLITKRNTAIDKGYAGKKSRNPMPGSRGSRWRKRMDGTVEARPTGDDETAEIIIREARR